MKVLLIIGSILFLAASGALAEMRGRKTYEEGFEDIDYTAGRGSKGKGYYSGSGGGGGCGDCCKLSELSSNLIANAISTCAQAPQFCSQIYCQTVRAIFVNYAFSDGSCDGNTGMRNSALLTFLCNMPDPDKCYFGPDIPPYDVFCAGHKAPEWV
jgi:hypothetical protein